jgi:nicotinamide mononucleotide transporter
MSGILQAIWEGMTSATPLEQSATILGVLGVWLMIRQSLWAFPVGLVQVALSAVVFHQYRLYADRNLQAVFFAVLAYGWWHWFRGEKTQGEGAQVGVLSWAWRAAFVVLGCAASGAWGWYQAHYTDAAMPYRDAFISSFSILAQWLQARRKLENWHGWILVNATAVPVYWLAGMHWFSVLYFLFLLMALGGLREWHADRARRKGVVR